MDKIYLSDAGPKVSKAIYGFWRWTEQDLASQDSMENIVNLCLELGINTFDHADFYGGYECEKRFGQLIAKKMFRREDVVLFSKCGLVKPHASMPEVRIPHINSTAAHIVKTAEQSLRNLRTDYLDLFLLDRLDPLSNLEETAVALEQLKSSGKIRNIGISHFTVFQHQLLAAYLRVPIVTNYINLSLLQTEALENGQLDYIKQRYMHPIAAAPLAGGRIENGTDEQATNLRVVLKAIAEKYGANMESIAVAWLNKLGALPLIGTLKESRIRNIAGSFEIQLDHQDWYELYQASSSEERQ